MHPTTSSKSGSHCSTCTVQRASMTGLTPWPSTSPPSTAAPHRCGFPCPSNWAWHRPPQRLRLGRLEPHPPGRGAAAGTAAAAPAGAVRRDFSWNAPPTLAVSSVAALQASLARAASPWTLSWARLGAIDGAAVPLLADQFPQWAERDVQLVFSGVEKLNALLDAKTQSGDRATSPEWWRLRMAALGLMGKPDEFELVALDYCVTYEVSPPSWASPRCGYSDNEGVSSGSAPLA